MSVLIQIFFENRLLTGAWDKLSWLHILTASNSHAKDLGLISLDKRHGSLNVVIRRHFG